MVKRKKQEAPGELLTTSEVARIYGVHPSTVRRWCRQGKIKAHGTGPRGEKLFHRQDIAVNYLYRAVRKYLDY